MKTKYNDLKAIMTAIGGHISSSTKEADVNTKMS